MKSTYHLIGALWDGKPAIEAMPECVPFDATMSEVRSNETLFDRHGARRYVRLTELLSYETLDEIDGLCACVCDCETFCVADDLCLVSDNPTITAFVDLRTRQVLAELDKRLSHCKVHMMDGSPLSDSFNYRRLSLPWIIELTESIARYVSSRGIEFNAFGFPLVPKSCYATVIPKEIFPFTHRRSRFCLNPSEAAICFYMSDRRIYPRFERLFSEMNIYRQYSAVVVPDLTVTADMDEPWQRFIMLLNQLFGAAIASAGIKIIANTRCGSSSSLRYLGSVPKGVLCASGSLGCEVLKSELDYSFVSKLLYMRPKASLIYGKRDPIAFKQLETMGIPIKRYPDVHVRSIRAGRLPRVA